MSNSNRHSRVSGALGVLLSAIVGAVIGAFPAAAQPAPATQADKAQHAPSPAETAAIAEGAKPLKAGRFGTVMVYSPQGPPKSAALFVSGDGGWNLGVVGMGRALVNQGALVIGVDIRQYLHSLSAAAREHPACQMIGADFEDLSHRVQKQMGLTEYHVPVLVGYSSGATVVYAVLVQAPPGTFAGALSLGFAPDQDFGGAALCPGTGPGLHYTKGQTKEQKNELILEPAPGLKAPWVILQGQKDEVCDPAVADAFAAKIPSARVERLPLVGHGFGVPKNWMPQFLAAYEELVPRPAVAAERPAAINDLPLNEVPAEGSSPELAILLTGDGGWAGLDQELAARLAAHGVPTVALNSLKYFWSLRKPQQVADDLARIMRHYLAAWHKERVLLVGYSFGADVLPFAVLRLPQDLRAKVATLSLMGLDETASFEISVSEFLGTDTHEAPTRPELSALGPLPVLCIYGEGEQDSLCPTLNIPVLKREQVGKGHHFSGEYDQLADRILAFARTPRPHA